MQNIILILTSFWLIISTPLKAQQCLEIISNNTGLDWHFIDNVDDRACDIIEQVGTSGFKVYGTDLYPVMAYVQEDEGFARSFEVLNAGLQNETGYILFGREQKCDGTIGHRLSIKYPAHDVFNSWTGIFKDAVKKELLEILERPEDQLVSATSEEEALKRFGEIMELGLEGDIFEMAGFEKVPVSGEENFTRGSSTLIGTSINQIGSTTFNWVFDYSGIQSNGRALNSFFDIKLSTGITTVDDASIGFIITDQLNSAAVVSEAQTNFLTHNEAKIYVWFHFEGEDVYIKFSNRFSFSEAGTIVDQYFERQKLGWTNTEEIEAAIDPSNANRMNGMNCSLSWQWGKNCLLPYVYDDMDNTTGWFPGFAFEAGMATGLLDGLLGTIQFIYSMGKGVVKTAGFFASFYQYLEQVVEYGIKNQSFVKMGEKIYEDGAKLFHEKWESVMEVFELAQTMINELAGNYQCIIEDIFEGIIEWMGELLKGSKEPGYTVGIVAFEVILATFTGGQSAGQKFLPKIMKFLDGILVSPQSTVSTMLKGSKKVPSANGVVNKCKILGKGCFVGDTPVAMSSKQFRNIPAAYALAAMPLVAPIQNIQPDDIVIAHKHEASYYATASNDDELYIPGWQDYDYLDITPETWQIGRFIITEEDGSLVEIEANRPKKWFEDYELKEKGDQAFIVIEEMGIADYAVLQSIRPTIIDTRDYALNESGQVERPVITTYKRIANEISDYTFSNGQVISCTPNHPFFSSDRQAYIPVEELTFGESVQTSSDREVKFISSKTREKGEHVYNFEVWREHNYFVGFEGREDFVLVHNACWKTIDDALNRAKTTVADFKQIIKDGWDQGIDWNPIDGGRATGYFGRGRFFEGLLWKGKYKKKGYKYTGKDDLGEGLGVSNYPIVDVYKGSTATSIKTTKNNNPWAWRNQNSANGTFYNQKHLDDIIDGFDNGGFGSHPDLTGGKITKLDLDIYVKEIDTQYPQSVWQQMVDDYLTSKGANALIGKVKVNLSTVEGAL